MDQTTAQKLERAIGYTFSNKELLATAFTHASAVDNRLLSNERLEFLGDSILALIVCQALFERFPGYLEGDLTKVKSMLVSRSTCARIAKKLDLHKSLKIGKGMISSRALTGSLAAGTLEAVIAAIYIDGGFNEARDFIFRILGPMIEQSNAEHSHGNFKSMLQQYSQERFNVTPNYILLDEKGPDHDKCFELEVSIVNRHFPSAWGNNKKEAEQKAAYNALLELGVIKESSSVPG